jgi:hypothetical protein
MTSEWRERSKIIATDLSHKTVMATGETMLLMQSRIDTQVVANKPRTGFEKVTTERS